MISLGVQMIVPSVLVSADATKVANDVALSVAFFDCKTLLL